MWQRLTCEQEIEAARRFVSTLLDERGEWFCTEHASANARRDVSTSQVNAVTATIPEVNAVTSILPELNGVTSALRAGEWELRAAHGSLFLSLLTARGARLWRINAWEWTGERLLLSATRRAGAESSTLELIPRASASVAHAALEAARRARCERMAALICSAHPHAKLERATLSRGARRGEHGRYARIVIGTRRERIAATGPVAPVAAHETDAFLAATLLWFARLGDAARERRLLRLRLVVPHAISAATSERVALLRADLRRVISIDEADDDLETLKPVRALELEDLLEADAPRLPRPPETPLSDAAREIIAHAPAAIDVVRARQGETLRFHGLAFARVRRWLGREQVWFGVEAATRNRSPADTPAAPQRRANGSTTAAAVASRRQLLDETNRAQFLKLLQELHTHRRAAPANPRHAFYTAAPEAWLESLLRRDITRLDPSLRLSPLHAQFRTSGSGAAAAAARPIDLLALRRDGRLVVIELKVSEDAALPLQGADYWRRVEAARRRGRISASRLFGDAGISDQPPLVYLVAPLLSFHRSLPTLARAITPHIEIYRLVLNEDWRASIRTSRVQTLTK
jgi:hypothetical protein